jgi:hypothetical protein
MSDSDNAVEMVRFGYNEDTRNLNFRVGFYLPRELDYVLESIKVIDQYNDFNYHNVVPAVREVCEQHLAPYSEVYVGREGSPVIYFESRNGDADLDMQEIENLLNDANCDEFDVEETRYKAQIRAWWD